MRVEPVHHPVDRLADELVVGNRLDIIALDTAKDRRKQLQLVVGDGELSFTLRQSREIEAEQQPEHRAQTNQTCLFPTIHVSLTPAGSASKWCARLVK